MNDDHEENEITFSFLNYFPSPQIKSGYDSKHCLLYQKARGQGLRAFYTSPNKQAE